MGFESRSDIFLRFNHFTPYNCKKILSNIETDQNFSNSVNNFITLFEKDKKGFEVPLPLTLKTISKKGMDISRKNSLFLSNARELYEIGLKISQNLKGTIHYYSWHSFFAFLTYSFFYYKDTSHGHGMYVVKMFPNDIEIKFNKRSDKGFFYRILDLFTILGYPTAFSDKLPIIDSENINYINNDISEISLKKGETTKFSINDLLKFDLDVFIDKYDKKYGNIKPTTKLFNESLIYYAIIFIASNFERYRPHYWSKILNAENEFTSNFVSYTREAYNKYVTFITYFDSYILRTYTP